MGKGRDARRKFRRGRNVDYAERQSEDLREKFSAVVESTAELTTENIRLSEENRILARTNERLEQKVSDADFVMKEHEKHASDLIKALASERGSLAAQVVKLTHALEDSRTSARHYERNWVNAQKESQANLEAAIAGKLRVRELEEALAEEKRRTTPTASTHMSVSNWRRLAQFVHPDKHPEKSKEEATEAMRLVNLLRPPR